MGWLDYMNGQWAGSWQSSNVTQTWIDYAADLEREVARLKRDLETARYNEVDTGCFLYTIIVYTEQQQDKAAIEKRDLEFQLAKARSEAAANSDVREWLKYRLSEFIPDDPICADPTHVQDIVDNEVLKGMNKRGYALGPDGNYILPAPTPREEESFTDHLASRPYAEMYRARQLEKA